MVYIVWINNWISDRFTQSSPPHMSAKSNFSNGSFCLTFRGLFLLREVTLLLNGVLSAFLSASPLRIWQQVVVHLQAVQR